MRDPFGIVGCLVGDRYLVHEVVAEGGFSVVYRAEHIVWRRPVAIKAFKGAEKLTPEERERLLQGFLREGAILADLSELTAAICQARDTSSFTTKAGDFVPYLVLEWLDGQPLDRVLKNERAHSMRPRSLTEAMRLVAPVAEALSCAHDAGIAHLDVKPGNLFVLGDPRGDARLKLLDFGIAKVIEEQRRSSQVSGQTATTVVDSRTFTPTYGAPEQFVRTYGPTGPWTDVFAVALVLVELVSGRQALRGETIAQLGKVSMNATRRPTPRAHGAIVSDAVEAVFASALALEPFDRYLSMREFWSALERAAAGEIVAPAPLVPLERERDDEIPSVSTSARATRAPRGRTVKRKSIVRRRGTMGALALVAAGALAGLLVPRSLLLDAVEVNPVRSAGAAVAGVDASDPIREDAGAPPADASSTDDAPIPFTDARVPEGDALAPSPPDAEPAAPITEEALPRRAPQR